MLGQLIREMVDSGAPAMRQLHGGARLYWSAERAELLIARINAAPPAPELAIFRREIRSAGFEIVSERAGSARESLINSWEGAALKLRRAPAPVATDEAPEQLTLGIE